jgi:hypothetical protein
MIAREHASPRGRGDSEHRSVLKQIDELNQMSTEQLRKRWTDLFGNEPPRVGRGYLVRRLAYRIQELVYGGLSQEAKRKLASIAESSNGSTKPAGRRQGGNLQPGTRLLRDWHGVRYEVTVQEDGFLYDGKKYRSLSAVARAITGSYWSGNRFFGLTPGSKKERSRA